MTDANYIHCTALRGEAGMIASYGKPQQFNINHIQRTN